MILLTNLSITQPAVTSLLSSATEREVGLIVALVIFIVLSVILAAILILLFVSKRFRAFFFRTDGAESENKEKPKKRVKSAKPKNSDDGKAAPRRESMAKIRQKREPSAASSLDEVPTVPLGGFSTATDDEDVTRRTSDAYITMSTSRAKRAPAKNADSANDTLDKVPTFVIPQATVDNVRTAQSAAKRSAATAKADKKPQETATAKKPTKPANKK